ncbi:MAG: DUF1302 domain-containing protein [Betaproteobacteria bacterium]|nr:DUF1302 domain-containing protein [Betaproteobacteria bacterium]
MTPAFRPTLKPLAIALALASAGPAFAFQFDFDNGIKGSLDTTLSYGVSVRAGSRESNLIGIANGGTSRSVNEDDGNLNYERNKAFANLVKATSDLEIKYGKFGFFGRGTAYYDFENANNDKLGPTAKDRVGKDVQGLDGFVFGAFDPFGKNLRVRAGRQVISWGESTFIPNGINAINPVDLSKLRIPGSEIKEAFLPTTGLWANQELTNNASLEGFYLTNHDKIRIDPRGTYFSNNDFASDDSDRVILSFGRRRDQNSPPSNPVPPVVPTLGNAAAALYGPFDPAASVWAPREADRSPSDNGKWGLALRYLATELNNTEFGVYYMNYHSRIPLFSGIKGTPTSVLTGGPLIAPICAQAALRSLCHTGTATYFAEFPEDIRLTGFSFNTQGPLGIALQGEYSYRSNLPLQYTTPELLLAALGLPNTITGFTQIPGAPAGATAAALVPDGSYIQGYKRVKASQFQLTGTKSQPSVLGAEQLVLLGEAGYTYFHGLPKDVKFNGPANFLPVTAFGATLSSAFSVQETGFVTTSSWGYRLLGRLEYNNALLGGNLSPRLAWSHDVKGTSPTFNEGAKSASLGVAWDYQRKWLVDMQYTAYMGGRNYCGTDTPPAGSSVTPGQSASYCSGANPLKDRDFYSLSVSYSF